MNIYVSYFYNIRFFPENLLPVSTAAWDPKWFHNFGKSNVVFRDKRNVVNGVRMDEFAPISLYDPEDDCPQKGTPCKHTPDSCNFLKKYNNHLDTLDFTLIIDKLKELNNQYNTQDVCLIVYEKPDNPCSERTGLIRWFKEHNIKLVEWTKPSKD